MPGVHHRIRLFNEPDPRHTNAYMLHQAGVSKKIRAEMSGRFIETAMKHGHPKAREKGRAVEALDEMATNLTGVDAWGLV